MSEKVIKKALADFALAQQMRTEADKIDYGAKQRLEGILLPSFAPQGLKKSARSADAASKAIASYTKKLLKKTA